MGPVLLASIAEALVWMDTRERNEFCADFLGNYSITRKSNRACECDIALGQYHTYMCVPCDLILVYFSISDTVPQ